jgi:hypothetical protein
VGRSRNTLLAPERGILVSYEIVRRWVNHFDGREPLESAEPMPSLIVSSPIRGYRDMHLGGHSACAEGPLGSIMDLDEQARRILRSVWSGVFRRHHRSPALARKPAGRDPGRAFGTLRGRTSDALFPAEVQSFLD